GDNRFDLLFALGPGPVHRRFFASQVRLHLLKLIPDCSHPLVKLRAGEILKDSRFLIVLSAQSQPGLTEQRHVYSQSFGKACGEWKGCDQYSPDTTYVQNVLG